MLNMGTPDSFIYWTISLGNLSPPLCSCWSSVVFLGPFDFTSCPSSSNSTGPQPVQSSQPAKALRCTYGAAAGALVGRQVYHVHEMKAGRLNDEDEVAGPVPTSTRESAARAGALVVNASRWNIASFYYVCYV